MSRALITTFHNYSESLNTDYYKIFYDYFVESSKYWRDLVDQVYIIDTNWNFTIEDTERIKAVFYKSSIAGDHAVQYQNFLPQIEEDEIFFMDNDVFIYKREGLKKWFDALKDNDAVISWRDDGSIKEPAWKKFPIMKKAKATGMESCYFLLTKKVLKKIGSPDFGTYRYEAGDYIKELDYITKKGDFVDVFGILTYQLLDKGRIKVIAYIDGCHHERACSYAYLLLSYKKNKMKQYIDNLSFKSNHVPKLLWFWHIDTKEKHHKEILEIVKDFGLSENLWAKYIIDFKSRLEKK